MERMVGRRVIVIGPSCSGKSTVAARLAEITGAPVIELDALHWEPGWIPADYGVFRDRVRQATSADHWILCGSYLTQQQDVSWPRADSVVWLDMPLRLTLPRLVSRSWTRARRKELLWGTNHERFWPQLKLWDTEKSLIAYSLRTHRSRRLRDAAQMTDPRWSHIRFIRLDTRGKIEAWLAEVATASTAANVV